VLAVRYGWTVADIQAAPWKVAAHAIELQIQDEADQWKRQAYNAYLQGAGGDKCKTFGAFMAAVGLEKPKPTTTKSAEEMYAWADEVLRKQRETNDVTTTI
jgi:hypothetical protein